MTQAEKVRHFMRVETRLIPKGRDLEFRQVRVEDARLLGILLSRSFAQTIDDEGETPEQGEAEMTRTLTGKYGPLLDFASFLIESEGRVVSTSVVTLYKERPLLAFSMTDPDYQNRGLSRFLIERSITALAERGYAELTLAVTEGNAPAQHLYSALGFKAGPKPTQSDEK